MTARRAGNLRADGGRGARRAPGLSLLEVVLAVVMLTGVATAILSAMSYIERSDARDRKRLAAYEIANRLVLQWLDDYEQMPEEWLPIAYGTDRYTFFYEMSLTPVVMRLNERQARGETALQGLDRYRLLTIRVLEADTTDPARPRPGDEIAMVWRVFDPVAPRNPDALTRFGENPDKILEVINQLLGNTNVRPAVHDDRDSFSWERERGNRGRRR